MSDISSGGTRPTNKNYPEGQVSLDAWLRALWDGKKYIALCSAIGASMCMLISLTMPNSYTANSLLVPAESSNGGFSGFMRQYGGLASLAGVTLPGGEEISKAKLGIQLMQSRAFLTKFIERRKILPEIMAAKTWDSDSNSIVLDPKLYDENAKVWVPEFLSSRALTPSSQEAYSSLLKMISVEQDTKTGFISVSVTHKSPVFAANLANWLVEDVNAAVKNQDISEAQRSITFLTQQVGKTSLADLQSMFFELIQSQTETMMLAEVRSEYVFKTIDQAVAPEKPSGPARAVISILGGLLGAVVGAVVVVIRYFGKT